MNGSKKSRPWYMVFITTRPVYCYGLTSVIVGVLIILWYVTLYSMLQERISYAHRAYAQTKSQLIATDIIEKNLTAQQHIVDTLQQEIKQQVAVIKEHQQHDPILSLFDTLKEHQLELLGYQPLSDKDKGWYIKKSAVFEVKGVFEQLVSFLQTVEASTHMLVCSDIHITKQDTGLQCSYLVSTKLPKEECYVQA